MSKVDWSRHPAVMVWTDDWNMCSWAPDRATYEATRHLPFMATPWSAGTLETAAETEALFAVIRRHRGGDGLPAVFEPYYVVGNPDYDAIAAAGFRDYLDVGIDQGVSPGWERGAFLDAARAAIAEGIWQPEYHHRTHHFSGAAWVRRLRAGDAGARDLFQRRMYVAEPVAARTRENDQPGPEPYAWIRVGAERFARAFDGPPRAIRNGEQDPGPIAAAGIRTEVNVAPTAGRDATGGRSGAGDLFLIGRCCDFEPFMAGDEADERVVTRSLGAVFTQLDAGRPAALSSHRRNYVSFAGDVPRNLALLDDLLGRLRQARPEVAFLTSDEVRRLWETGASIRPFGSSAVVRHWGPDNGRPLPVAVPAGYEVAAVEATTGGGFEPDVAEGGRRLLVPPGSHRVTLRPRAA